MKKKKIINILGKGDGWRRIFEDHAAGKLEGSETYGCNDVFIPCPFVSKTFHMHDMDVFLEQEKSKYSTKKCIEVAKERPDMEFYTLDVWDKIKNSKKYPLDKMVEHFGVCYFTNTIDYMIAFALYNGATELNFYGVNMTVLLEYKEQKPSVEYWLGRAMGMGVKCNLQHDVTSLLKSKDGLLYGYLIPQWRVDDEEEA